MNGQDPIVEYLKKKINDYQAKTDIQKVGTVVEIGDGIARVFGLDDVASSEMLEFPGGTIGLALNL